MPAALPAQLDVDAGRAVEPASGHEIRSIYPHVLGCGFGLGYTAGYRMRQGVEVAPGGADDPARRRDSRLGRHGGVLRQTIPWEEATAGSRRISFSSSSSFASRCNHCVSAA